MLIWLTVITLLCPLLCDGGHSLLYVDWDEEVQQVHSASIGNVSAVMMEVARRHMLHEVGSVPDISVVAMDDNCDVLQVLQAMQDMRNLSYVGVIGSRCSTTTEVMSRVCNLYKKPLVGYSSPSLLFDDKKRHPYFLRTSGSYHTEINAWVSVFRSAGWMKVSLLVDAMAFNTLAQLVTSFASFGIEVVFSAVYSSDMHQALRELKQSSTRIILMIVESDSCSEWSKVVEEVGLRESDGYYWITTCGMLRAGSLYWKYRMHNVFAQRVNDVDSTLGAPTMHDAFVADAFYIFFRSVYDMEQVGLDVTNGTLLYHHLRSLKATCPSGMPCSWDNLGNRVEGLFLDLFYNNINLEAQIVGTFSHSAGMFNASAMRWGSQLANKIPNFEWESTESNKVIIPALGSALSFLLLLAVGVLLYKRRLSKQYKELFHANQLLEEYAVAIGHMDLHKVNDLKKIENPSRAEMALLSIFTSLKTYKMFLPEVVFGSESEDVYVTLSSSTDNSITRVKMDMRVVELCCVHIVYSLPEEWTAEKVTVWVALFLETVTESIKGSKVACSLSHMDFSANIRWNAPGVSIADIAVETAISLVQSAAYKKLIKKGNIGMGVARGVASTGNLGNSQIKQSNISGTGLNYAATLAWLSHSTKRPVVVSAKLKSVCSIRVRFSVIDYIQPMTPEGPLPDELVYEALSLCEPDANEWMYQLEEIETHAMDPTAALWGHAEAKEWDTLRQVMQQYKGDLPPSLIETLERCGPRRCTFICYAVDQYQYTDAMDSTSSTEVLFAE